MESKLNVEFKRKVYDKMLIWKEKYAPNYALLLKGSIRVGKFTLANKLGREDEIIYLPYYMACIL